MKKIIKEMDEKRGIVQVTIADERWYLKTVKDADGMPYIKSVPSITWIAQSYPKGIQYFKWLADHGWDEAEAIKIAAGDKGSKVHLAIEDVLQHKEVRIDSKYINKTTEKEEELTLEECDAVLSFINWSKETKPITIAWETTVFSEKHNYAGTIDYICKIGDDIWIIDFKTSQQVWPSHELQVNAYKRAIESGENPIMHNGKPLDVSNIKMGILQVGYRRNKNQYKFTEVENKFDLFLAAQTIWKNENSGIEPTKKDYPIVLSPALTVDAVLESQKVEVTPKKKAVKK